MAMSTLLEFGVQVGQDEELFAPKNPKMRSQNCLAGWELPTGILLLLLLHKSLRISLSLNNSDKMSVTMATRENRLIGEVSDICNA